MDDYLSEKEQIEAMRSWWKENGTYIVVGLLVGVGAVVGVTQWRAAQSAQQEAASALFEDLADEVAENRLEPAEVVAADMYDQHPTSIYADQARLAMARLYMDQGRDQDAASTLRALVDGGSDPQMRMVGRLRLGKVLLYQGKSEEVLELLEAYTDSGMGARVNEVIGDAHFALGQYAQAEAAYLAALSAPVASQLVDGDLLRMKINDLPDIPDVAEEESTNESDDDVAAPADVDDSLPEAAAEEEAAGASEAESEQ